MFDGRPTLAGLFVNALLHCDPGRWARSQASQRDSNRTVSRSRTPGRR